MERYFLNKRLTIGFALAIILVIAVGFISYSTFKTQENQALLVKNTYQIINQIQKVQGLLIDMETGRRGYRVTQDRKFLEPYNRGLMQLNPSYEQLILITKDKTTLSGNLLEMKNAIDTLLGFWGELNITTNKFLPEEVRFISNEEKKRMDEVRNIVSEIFSKLNKDLQVQEAENNRAIEQATIALIISILLILTTVIILIYQVVKEFKNRKKAEVQLHNNNNNLVTANEEKSAQNWILLGVASINNALQNDENVEDLSNALLQAIVTYTKADAGGLYIYDPEKDKLVLAASQAFPIVAKKEYNLKEGFVGQAAVQMNPLIIKDIPPEQIIIESGSVICKPAEVLYSSITLHGEIKAVVEILHFKTFDQSAIKLIEVVKNNIAIAIHSAQSRQKVIQLLEQVQKQKDILENQQEELQQVNEELSTQAEILQASEEELRVQEEELRQINAELEEKNETIESASHSLIIKAKELEEISRYKSDFLANMSHELRTPLNSILILAKLLAENNSNTLTEKQVKHAEIIHKSGSDLLQLINDVLDLSKIEAGKIELNFADEKLAHISNNMHQLFSIIADGKQIDFKINLDNNLPAFIETDPQKLEQVLTNLLSNAFKFTEPKGSVKLDIFPVMKNDLPAISFRVSDTGIGIPKSKHQIIFNAFQQADSSTNRKYGGTGLGLSIINKLVFLLGGVIDVESEEGMGSSFTVTIPAGKCAFASKTSTVDKIKNPQQNVILDDRDILMPGDDLMLVIEDDLPMATIIRDFAHTKNYKVIVALRGDEGLQVAKKYNPSVIILDMSLPGLDGASVLKQLKADEYLCHIPVHIITAFNEIKSPEGAFSFLRKPFHLKEFERALIEITNHLKSTIKKILLVSNDVKNNSIIKNLLQQKNPNVKFEIAETIDMAAQKLESILFDLLIIDLVGNIDAGIRNLQLFHAKTLLAVPAIVLIEEDILPAKELELKKLANVIVRKSESSNDRLMDELNLFLYRIKEGKMENIPVLHSSENEILNGKKILLVDDDMRNVFALNAALEQKNMQVITASDGMEAIQILQWQTDIDIVLMDVMMPAMDGYKAMEIIRNELGLKTLPVIALTAKAMTGDKEKCIAAGASDYITKPVDVQRLLALMSVWLA